MNTTTCVACSSRGRRRPARATASNARFDRTKTLDKTRRIGDTVDRVAAAASLSTPADFLSIDASLTYSTSNRPFEDLPENFLENISPHHQQQMNAVIAAGAQGLDAPQLAALAPMSITTASCGDSSVAYATLVPMAAAPAYASISSLKMEPHGAHADGIMSQSHLDKNSFGNGPAGLLSPLHHLTHTPHPDLSLHHHRANGTSSTSGGRYVKMEMIGDEQDRRMLAQAETPPAVSNVELASNIIASLIGEQEAGSPSPTHHHHDLTSMHLLNRGGVTSTAQSQVASSHSRNRRGINQAEREHADASIETKREIVPASSSHASRVIYSTKDTSDPLNAEIDEDIYIDTKDLCRRIGYELKMHSIPQAIFAERILCRSQGTLSDLLRNPKPWNKLKSGRETFRRMYNWVQQPLHQRLAILDMWKDGDATASATTNGHHPHHHGRRSPASGSNNGAEPAIEMMTPPTPAQNARNGGNAGEGARERGAGAKRPRLVFTDIQKRTLQAIFKETQRPSREMQQTIAEHLRLDLSTVANFFMNARRRSRCGPLNSDEPAPYQQVRAITPPPASPPPRTTATGTRSRTRAAASTSSSCLTTTSALIPHIEDTVATVVEESAEYARKRPVTAATSGDGNDKAAAIAAIYNDIQATTSAHLEGGEPKMKTAKRSTSSDDDENDLDEDDEDDEEELDVDGSSPTRFVASNVQKKGENVYVVQVQTPITSGAATHQRRSLPVMSMNKTITVKVERETPSSSSSTINTTAISPSATVEQHASR